MNNLLANAGFLDQATGWTGSSVLTLSVDETEHGAPGRMVLRGIGTATSSGQTITMQPATAQRPSVDAGVVVEARTGFAAFVAGQSVAPAGRLIFRDAGGVQTGAVDLTVTPPPLALHGVARAGLIDTFHRGYARATAPAGTATATLEERVTANSGQVVELLMLKPLIGIAPSGRSSPLTWSPGVATTDDLELPAWPAVLSPFLGGAGGEPRASRVEFEADQGRPASRPNALDAVRRYDGSLRCDPVQREALETFARTAGDFYIVEPGSDRLCVASFAADGAPRLAEDRGPTAMMSVGLWLETA